jgi:TetR/AcrR family transcriptional repressor of bet genes
MAERTPPRFRRLGPDERRQALIRATMDCLSRYGPHGTGVREISRQVNVSPGLVRHYFGSKEELILETFRTVTAAFETTIRDVLQNSSASADDRIKAFFHSYFSTQVTEEGTVGAYLAFWNLARTDRTVRRLQRSAYRNLRTMLEPVLKRLAVDRGAAIDEKQTAIALIAMLDGLWLELCLDSAAFSRAKAVSISSAWLDAYLRSNVA